MASQPENQCHPPSTPASPALKARNELSATVKEIDNDVDFAHWYGSIENDLLEASYEEYQYLSPGSLIPIIF